MNDHARAERRSERREVQCQDEQLMFPLVDHWTLMDLIAVNDELLMFSPSAAGAGHSSL